MFFSESASLPFSLWFNLLYKFKNFTNRHHSHMLSRSPNHVDKIRALDDIFVEQGATKYAVGVLPQLVEKTVAREEDFNSGAGIRPDAGYVRSTRTIDHPTCFGEMKTRWRNGSNSMVTRRGGDPWPSLHWLATYPQAYELGMTHDEDMAPSSSLRSLTDCSSASRVC